MCFLLQMKLIFFYCYTYIDIYCPLHALNQVFKMCPQCHCLSLEPAKSSASAVVKTVPAASPSPRVVMMSSMKVPLIKPAPKSTTAPPPSASVPAPSLVKPASPVTTNTSVQVDTSCSAVTDSTASFEKANVQTSVPAKAKSTINFSVSKPQNKVMMPSTAQLRPQSPMDAVQSINNKPLSPASPPAPVIGKPISSVPMYKPAATAHVAPPSQSTPTPATTTASTTHATRSLPVTVLQGGDNRSTPSGRVTPSGRTTPFGRRTPIGKPGEGFLRQGVPQKPYTFMDEKAR